MATPLINQNLYDATECTGYMAYKKEASAQPIRTFKKYSGNH